MSQKLSLSLRHEGLKTTVEHLGEEIEDLHKRIDGFKAILDNLRDRIKMVETEVTALLDGSNLESHTVVALADMVKKTQERVQVLENRLERMVKNP